MRKYNTKIQNGHQVNVVSW